MTVIPGARALDARRQKGLVPAFEFHAIAARHEQTLSDRRAIALACLGAPFTVLQFRKCLHRGRPAALHIARGKAEQHMRRAVIGLHLIRVKLLARRVDVAQIVLILPMNEVLRGGGANGTITSGFPVFFIRRAAGEITPVGAINTAVRIPKREVLRIKGPVRDHRRFRHR